MASQHELLLTVKRYAFAHWRYAIGHPRSGELARVERYEQPCVDYALHLPTGTVRRY